MFNVKDPYVIIYCCDDPSGKKQSRQHKTDVKMDSGASANWEKEFIFVPIDHRNKKMLIVEVWDSDRWTADDLIGSTLIGLSLDGSTPPDSRCKAISISQLSCPC